MLGLAAGGSGFAAAQGSRRQGNQAGSENDAIEEGILQGENSYEHGCQVNSLRIRFFLCQTPAPASSPATSNSSVPGSGTAATSADETATAVLTPGVPLTDGSKMNVPPAPTVKFDPPGRAPLLFTISVPASTFVPPP